MPKAKAAPAPPPVVTSPLLVLDVPHRYTKGVAATQNAQMVGFSPDGRDLLTAGFGGAVRWDLTSSSPRLVYAGYQGRILWGLAVDEAMRFAVAGHNDLEVWDYAQGTPLRTLSGHVGIPTSIAFAPDGKRLASGCPGDNTVRVWDVEQGQELWKAKLKRSGAWRVAFSPDGKRVVSAGADKVIHVWDAARGVETTTFAGHTGQIEGLSFAREKGTLLSVSRDRTARVWDTKGNEKCVLSVPKKGLTAGSLSADGAFALTGGADGLVRLWAVRSGAELARFEGHGSAVVSVAFSPDEETIASTDGGAVRLWTAPVLRAGRAGPGRCPAAARSPRAADRAATALLSVVEAPRVVIASASMAFIRIIEAAEAEGELGAIYEAMKHRPLPAVYRPPHGGPAGIHRAHSLDAGLLRATFAATGTMHLGEAMTWAERELMAAAASYTNQCVY